MSLLGLDIGTTGCKAIVFDPEGKVLAGSYREYSLVHPRPGWNELDVHTLWDGVRTVIQEVNAVPFIEPVAAMGISCQGEAVIPMDLNGDPLYHFIITFDSRTGHMPAWWKERLSPEDIFSITGMPLHPMYTINKILWFKEEGRDIFKKTWKFLCVEDYIIFRLTGEAVIDFSLAARTMAFDVRTSDWSPVMLSAAGIETEKLAVPAPSGTAVGRIRKDLLCSLGFKGPVTVATGGHDQACGALGSGVYRSGTAMAAMGTSEVICPVSDRPCLTPYMLEHNYSSSAHVETGKYVALAVNLNGGLLLRWYRDTLCEREVTDAEQSGTDPYDLIISEASEEWKSIYILPHLVGSGTPHFDTASKGAILGLTNETTKGDITRALLVSLVLETKIDLVHLAEAGFCIRDLRAIGGGAKSDRWLQMKADGLGIPIRRMKVTEAASLGAALLAGKASGVYASCREGIEHAVQGGRIFEPDPRVRQQYEEHFAEYRAVYPSLATFYHGINKNRS